MSVPGARPCAKRNMHHCELATGLLSNRDPPEAEKRPVDNDSIESSARRETLPDKDLQKKNDPKWGLVHLWCGEGCTLASPNTRFHAPFGRHGARYPRGE